MSEKDNVQVVKNAYTAFQKKDMDALFKLFADDIRWTTPGPQDVLPFAGERRGHDGVRQFFKQLEDSEEMTKFEPKEYIAQGDRVVALGHYEARIKSNNRTNAIDWAHVFNVRNGKIHSFLEFFDTARSVEAYREGGAAKTAKTAR